MTAFSGGEKQNELLSFQPHSAVLCVQLRLAGCVVTKQITAVLLKIFYAVSCGGIEYCY
jgi:hypothetical protein